MSDFNLIIFDECHNATKNHPMRQFMDEYRMSGEPRPRVIGLTGMLTSPSVKPQNVEDDLKRVEYIFHSAIATVKGLDAFNEVLNFSTAPKEHIIEYEKPLVPPIISYIANEVLELTKFIDAWPVNASHMRTQNNLSERRTASPLKVLRTLWNDFVIQLNDFGRNR